MKNSNNIDFKSQLNSFIDFLRFERYLSKNTIDSYQRDLLLFNSYLEEQKIHFLDITHENIINFLENLYKNYTESSISRILSSLRVFYKFLLREEVITFNPFSQIKNPKKPIKIVQVLDADEVKKFLDSIPHATALQLRDKAMFELLYSSGMRVSEIVNLRLNDIDYEDRIIRCIGKGNKERLIPIGETSLYYLKAYINSARSKIHKSNKKTKSNDFVFLNKNGQKITRQGFWKILKKYEKKFNFEKNIYPHLFRHSYATHMLQNGADLRLVQELLGHCNISTTEVYTNINKKFIKESFVKNHPRNKN
jgi:integrase/recombinase XerD